MTSTTQTPISLTTAEADNALARALVNVLSATDLTLRSTQLAHWNVTGANFFGLHAALEEQYNELFAAVDAVAERIRALGEFVPASYAAGSDSIRQGRELHAVIAGHDATIAAIEAALQVASEAGDEVTAGLLLDRLGTHQKTVWMLKAATTA